MRFSCFQNFVAVAEQITRRGMDEVVLDVSCSG